MKKGYISKVRDVITKGVMGPKVFEAFGAVAVTVRMYEI